MTWRDLLDRWDLIEADLQDANVDVGDMAVLRGRSWRWGQARITGLLSRPPVGFVKVPAGDKVRVEPLWGTRIQAALLARDTRAS